MCVDKGWDRERMENFLATCVYYQHPETGQTANTLGEVEEAELLATVVDAGPNWETHRNSATGQSILLLVPLP